VPTDPDSSLDLTGVGKLAKAIPPKSWEKLVTTACDTFTKCIAPITETTSGIGRLIQAWFDKLVDAQKVMAADTLSKASAKISSVRKKKTAHPNGSVMIAALTAASNETNDTLRELWSNLLAQEMAAGEVHPEFVEILKRISVSDARTLAKIAKEGDRTWNRVVMNAFVKTLIRIDLAELTEGSTFSHEQLAKLNLIRRKEGLWNLTETGKAFIETVSDPTVVVEEARKKRA
jgi:hypothetical protein